MVVPKVRKLFRRASITSQRNPAEKRLFIPSLNTNSNRDRLLVFQADRLNQRLTRKQDPNKTRSISKMFMDLQKIDPIAAKRARRIFSNNGIHDLLNLSYKQERETQKSHHLSKIESIRRLPKPKIP